MLCMISLRPLSLQSTGLVHQLGQKTCICENLALNVMAKRSRWNQLALSPMNMMIAAYFDFHELRKQGFRFDHVLRAWHMSMASDTGYCVGLHVIKQLKPMFVGHGRCHALFLTLCCRCIKSKFRPFPLILRSEAAMC